MIVGFHDKEMQRKQPSSEREGAERNQTFKHYSLADSGGGRLVCTSRSVEFLSFSCSFRDKFDQKLFWRSQLWDLRPLCLPIAPRLGNPRSATVTCNDYYQLADSHSRWESPSGSNVFHFQAVLGKFWPIMGWCPPFRVGVLPWEILDPSLVMQINLPVLIRCSL